MIHFQVTVLNTAELLDTNAYGAGALLRWETSATQAGVYVEGGTAPLISGTTLYDVWDAAGTPGVTWYKTRVSNGAGSTFSAYSVVVQDGVPLTYATVDQVLALFETPITNSAKIARLTAAIGTATDEIISFFDGRDFFRHPTTGTETWLASEAECDGRILHVHDGLVTLTKLEVSLDRGTSFTEIASGNYVLRGSGPHQAVDPAGNQPAFHVELTGLTNFAWIGFPRWPQSVRLTGARGWPAIPASLVEGCTARARQLAYADPSYAGSNPGPPEYGIAPSADRLPSVLYRFQEGERRRFDACVFANERWPGIAGRGY